MKKILMLFSISLFLFVGCKKNPVNPPIDNSLNGTWKVVSYQNMETNTTITKISLESGIPYLSNSNNDIVITLNQKKDTLQLSGHTVTNDVSGIFKLGASDSMSCLSFGGTKVGEPNWGRWFWDAMYSASSYQLKGNNLIIYYNFQDNKAGRWNVTLIPQ